MENQVVDLGLTKILKFGRFISQNNEAKGCSGYPNAINMK